MSVLQQLLLQTCLSKATLMRTTQAALIWSWSSNFSMQWKQGPEKKGKTFIWWRSLLRCTEAQLHKLTWTSMKSEQEYQNEYNAFQVKTRWQDMWKEVKQCWKNALLWHQFLVLLMVSINDIGRLSCSTVGQCYLQQHSDNKPFYNSSFMFLISYGMSCNLLKLLNVLHVYSTMFKF